MEAALAFTEIIASPCLLPVHLLSCMSRMLTQQLSSLSMTCSQIFFLPCDTLGLGILSWTKIYILYILPPFLKNHFLSNNSLAWIVAQGYYILDAELCVCPCLASVEVSKKEWKFRRCGEKRKRNKNQILRKKTRKR